MIIKWGTPMNVQWYRVLDAMRLGWDDEAYYATINLVRAARRINDTVKCKICQ